MLSIQEVRICVVYTRSTYVCCLYKKYVCVLSIQEVLICVVYTRSMYLCCLYKKYVFVLSMQEVRICVVYTRSTYLKFNADLLRDVQVIYIFFLERLDSREKNYGNLLDCWDLARSGI